MINNFKKSSKKWSVAAMMFVVMLSSVALTNAQNSRHKMKDKTFHPISKETDQLKNNAKEHMMGGIRDMPGMGDPNMMGGMGGMRGGMGRIRRP